MGESLYSDAGYSSSANPRNNRIFDIGPRLDTILPQRKPLSSVKSRKRYGLRKDPLVGSTSSNFSEEFSWKPEDMLIRIISDTFPPYLNVFVGNVSLVY